MSESFTLVKGARLIDGLGGPPLERGAVLMQGKDIRAVGTEEAVAPPEGAQVEVLDYPDMTIMPSLTTPSSADFASGKTLFMGYNLMEEKRRANRWSDY